MAFVSWGEPDGIAEGTDFRLEAVLTRNGASDSAGTSTSGAYALTVRDSVLNAGVDLLSSVAVSSISLINTGTLVAWEITDVQSSGWEAGSYKGDIVLVDSGGTRTAWPITMKVRQTQEGNS